MLSRLCEVQRDLVNIHGNDHVVISKFFDYLKGHNISVVMIELLEVELQDNIDHLFVEYKDHYHKFEKKMMFNYNVNNRIYNKKVVVN
jgi:hypothetical protein